MPELSRSRYFVTVARELRPALLVRVTLPDVALELSEATRRERLDAALVSCSEPGHGLARRVLSEHRRSGCGKVEIASLRGDRS